MKTWNETRVREFNLSTSRNQECGETGESQGSFRIGRCPEIFQRSLKVEGSYRTIGDGGETLGLPT